MSNVQQLVKNIATSSKTKTKQHLNVTVFIRMGVH